MAESTYYWQGGRKIEIEQVGNYVTVEAENADEVQRAATDAGVELREAQAVSPGLVQVEIAADRDESMKKLRKSHVVHHLYATKGQPDDRVLVTDSFFIKFKSDTSERYIRQYIEDECLEIVEDFGNNSLLVRVTDATGKNPIRTANSAILREEVEYAEPNLTRELIRFGFIPADPHFTKQWHLHAPSNGHELVAGADISTPDAWEITKGRRDVVVAVMDDGFDLTHPDFIGQDKVADKLNVTVPVNGPLQYDSDVSPRAAPSPFVSGDYHGTPCAGVAVAELNGEGTVGVAPGCALLAVRFPLSIDDGKLATLFKRVSRDADVVSCSWGVGPADAPMSSTLRTVVADLSETGGRRGKGLVFCVAAGNNNCPVKDLNNTETYEFRRGGVTRRYNGPIDRWLAAHPDVVTVSACTSEKKRSAYSSWGREINVCAPSNNFDDLNRFDPPGLGIFTTDNEGAGLNTDFTAGSRYTPQFGGTSSATPTVAGVCGLVISHNQSLSGSDVRQIIEQTADKDLVIESATPVNEPGDFDANGFSLWFGYGKVNAAKAVEAASPDPVNQQIVDVAASDIPQEIPDRGDPILNLINVSENGIIEEFRVEVDITHTYIGDLRIDLLAPNGTAVTLHNHQGGDTNDLHRVYTKNEVPSLSSFEGLDIEGSWTLRVVDEWFWDIGTLRGWRIGAKVNVVPTPAMAESTKKPYKRKKAKQKV